jgi:hypothetical protein
MKVKIVRVADKLCRKIRFGDWVQKAAGRVWCILFFPGIWEIHTTGGGRGEVEVGKMS